MTKHEELTRQMAAGAAARGRKELAELASLAAKQERSNDRAAQRAAWHAYRDEVRRLTELQPLDQVRGIERRGPSHHLDHVVSIRRAWLEGWSPEQCANIDNLQMLPWQENFRKGSACFCTLDLQDRLTPN